MMPVGYTHIFLFLEKSTLTRPKNTPNNSMTNKCVGVSLYWEKIHSKMWFIIVSVGFYYFYVNKSFF